MAKTKFEHHDEEDVPKALERETADGPGETEEKS